MYTSYLTVLCDFLSQFSNLFSFFVITDLLPNSSAKVETTFKVGKYVFIFVVRFLTFALAGTDKNIVMNGLISEWGFSKNL